jgi:hypothetical protein
VRDRICYQRLLFQIGKLGQQKLLLIRTVGGSSVYSLLVVILLSHSQILIQLPISSEAVLPQYSFFISGPLSTHHHRTARLGFLTARCSTRTSLHLPTSFCRLQQLSLELSRYVFPTLTSYYLADFKLVACFTPLYVHKDGLPGILLFVYLMLCSVVLVWFLIPESKSMYGPTKEMAFDTDSS